MRIFQRRTTGGRHENDRATDASGGNTTSSSTMSDGGNGLMRMGSLESGGDASSSTSSTATPASLVMPLLRPQLRIHSGIPRGCTTLAYSRSQRLLALGSNDGRVKVLGNPGVERLFVCGARSAVAMLRFWEDQGVLLSISRSNRIEVFDLRLQRCVAHAQLGFTPTSLNLVAGVTIVNKDGGSGTGLPYVFIGDDIGTVHVFRMNRQRRTLDELPHELEKDLLDDTVIGADATGLVSPRGACARLTDAGVIRSDSIDDDAIIALMSQPGAEVDRVLICYASGLAYLWSFTESKVVAAVFDGRSRADSGASEGGGGSVTPTAGAATQSPLGRMSAAVWVGDAGEYFLTGHVSGAIALWEIPEAAKPVYATPKRVHVVHKPARILLAPEAMPDPGEPFPVVPITHLCYSSRMINDTSTQPMHVLVYRGGGHIDEPITAKSLQWIWERQQTGIIISSTNSNARTAGARLTTSGNDDNRETAAAVHDSFPFFGNVIDIAPVPVPDCTLQSVIVLSEGNTLQVHPVTSPRQTPMDLEPTLSRHPATVLSVFDGRELPVESGTGSAGDTSWYKVLGPDAMTPEPPRSPSLSIGFGIRWPVTGGDIGFGSDSIGGPVLLSGHRDGKVRLWASSAPGAPLLQETDPSSHMAEDDDDSHLNLNLPGRVTCVDACSASGMIAVGHANSQAQLWIFARERGRHVTRTMRVTPSAEGGSIPSCSSCSSERGAGFIVALRLVVEKSNVAGPPRASNAITGVSLSTSTGILVACDESGACTIVDIVSGTLRASVLPFAASSAAQSMDGGSAITVCSMFVMRSPPPQKQGTSQRQRERESPLSSTSSMVGGDVSAPMLCVCVVGDDSSVAFIGTSATTTKIVSTMRPKKTSLAVAIHCLTASSGLGTSAMKSGMKQPRWVVATEESRGREGDVPQEMLVANVHGNDNRGTHTARSQSGDTPAVTDTGVAEAYGGEAAALDVVHAADSEGGEHMVVKNTDVSLRDDRYDSASNEGEGECATDVTSTPVDTLTATGSNSNSESGNLSVMEEEEQTADAMRARAGTGDLVTSVSFDDIQAPMQHDTTGAADIDGRVVEGSIEADIDDTNTEGGDVPVGGRGLEFAERASMQNQQQKEEEEEEEVDERSASLQSLPLVEHVTLVSACHARVYSVDTLLRSERTHIYKISFGNSTSPSSSSSDASNCVFHSAAVEVCGCAVMACTTGDYVIHMYALPSLTAITSISLASTLGWTPDASLESVGVARGGGGDGANNSVLLAMSPGGVLALTERARVEPSTDYATVALFKRKRTARPSLSGLDGAGDLGDDDFDDDEEEEDDDEEDDDDDFLCYLFDEEVQNASNMARIAAEEQRRQEQQQQLHSRGTQAKKPNKVMSVFSKFMGGGSGGKDSRSMEEEEMLSPAKPHPSRAAMDDILLIAVQRQSRSPPPPSLPAATAAHASRSSPSSSSSSSSVVAAAAASGLASSSSNATGGGGGSRKISDDRAALFGSGDATQAPEQRQSPGNAKRRTVEEIKSAYGRPSASASASTAQHIMAENRDKLAERGEKLGELQEKTSKLENDAMNFADMARELRKQQEQKKWWQL